MRDMDQSGSKNSIDSMIEIIPDCIKLKEDKTKYKASYFIINLNINLLNFLKIYEFFRMKEIFV